MSESSKSMEVLTPSNRSPRAITAGQSQTNAADALMDVRDARAAAKLESLRTAWWEHEAVLAAKEPNDKDARRREIQARRELKKARETGMDALVRESPMAPYGNSAAERAWRDVHHAHAIRLAAEGGARAAARAEEIGLDELAARNVGLVAAQDAVNVVYPGQPSLTLDDYTQRIVDRANAIAVDGGLAPLVMTAPDGKRGKARAKDGSVKAADGLRTLKDLAPDMGAMTPDVRRVAVKQYVRRKSLQILRTLRQPRPNYWQYNEDGSSTGATGDR